MSEQKPQQQKKVYRLEEGEPYGDGRLSDKIFVSSDGGVTWGTWGWVHEDPYWAKTLQDNGYEKFQG